MATHSHTDGGVSHAKATASSSGAVGVRCLAQGAGDRTTNLAVTSQPALPPELLPHFMGRTQRKMADNVYNADIKIGSGPVVFLLYNRVRQTHLTGKK